MAMDMESGTIRAINSAEERGEKEVVFIVGEEIELRDCKFEIIAVYPDPANEITLKGVARK